MPIPQNCAKVALNFSLGNDELAVTGFHMQLQHGAGNQLSWPVAVTRTAKRVHDNWRTAWDALAGLYGPQVTLSHVDVYHLNADTGKTMDKGTYAPSSNPWKGTADRSMPQEVSLCVSLLGYTPGGFVPNRGRRRGRMYLPPMGTAVLAPGADPARQGRVWSGATNDLATSMQTFFEACQGMSDEDNDNPLGGQDTWDVGVLSKASGQFEKLQAIRIGDVFDAQLRRRNHQAEVYTEKAIRG